MKSEVIKTFYYLKEKKTVINECLEKIQFKFECILWHCFAHKIESVLESKLFNLMPFSVQSSVNHRLSIKLFIYTFSRHLTLKV